MLLARLKAPLNVLGKPHFEGETRVFGASASSGKGAKSRARTDADWEKLSVSLGRLRLTHFSIEFASSALVMRDGIALTLTLLLMAA